MNALVEKMNMDIQEEITNEKGITFCARNCVKAFNCKPEYIEQALNDADYYSEDGDYTKEDLMVLCDIVDEFGAQMMNYNQVFEKQVWFDVNE